MSSVLVIATVGCVLANTFVAIADYMRAPFVRENSAEVGLPPAALPYLATLKLAGAAGLVMGLLGAHGLGLAAGIGLTAFFMRRRHGPRPRARLPQHRLPRRLPAAGGRRHRLLRGQIMTRTDVPVGAAVHRPPRPWFQGRGRVAVSR